jgi:AcrR family transcriptional regulator
VEVSLNSADVAPYARIAAEVRAQIESGRLMPGDRVPSTREITRRWGVAMATATKALAALQRQGLVRVVPGVGTVVDAAVPPAPARPRLSSAGAPAKHRRDRPDGPITASITAASIVAAAIAVADAEGLAALSMRRVATDLGAATMSLYRHVADKDDLLLQMMNAVFEQARLPADPPDGWRARVELAGRMLWAVFRRHPWLAPAMSLTRPQPIAGGMAYTEWVLAALDGRGLDLATMLTAQLTLFNLARGTAIHLELEAEAEAASGMNSEQWLDTQQATVRSIVAGGRFPMMERLISRGYDLDLDALFEFGLGRVLDGLEVLISGRETA